jgi:hypothetical protein
MMNADALESLKLQLAAHRQTLAILLVQRAELGSAYAPPAVANGISFARSAIAQLKADLRSQGVVLADERNDAPDAPDSASTSLTPTPPHTSGDVIIATIGAAAQHVAVGKGITQISGALASSSSAPQRNALLAAWAGLRPTLAAPTAQLAEFQIELLAAELERLDADAAPSSNTVIRCAHWLLANLPQLTEPLVVLLSSPPVVAALSRTSADYAIWLAQNLPSESR